MAKLAGKFIVPWSWGQVLGSEGLANRGSKLSRAGVVHFRDEVFSLRGHLLWLEFIPARARSNGMQGGAPFDEMIKIADAATFVFGEEVFAFRTQAACWFICI